MEQNSATNGLAQKKVIFVRGTSKNVSECKESARIFFFFTSSRRTAGPSPLLSATRPSRWLWVLTLRRGLELIPRVVASITPSLARVLLLQVTFVEVQ